jgi:hypothetical protein
VRSEGLGKLKKFNYLIGSRSRDLPACGISPQPLRYRVPNVLHSEIKIYRNITIV